MCDNCRKELKVVQKDVTRDANKILQLIKDFENYSCNVTTKQVIDIVRGKSVKSNQIRSDLVDKFKGMMKSFSETHLRRCILIMLKNRILKESFVSIKIRGQATANISVYLQPGRFSDRIMKGEMKCYISDGIQPADFDMDFHQTDNSQDLRLL